MVPLPAEAGILGDLNEQVQVGPAPVGRLDRVGDAHFGPGPGPCRDLHFDTAPVQLNAASGAGIGFLQADGQLLLVIRRGRPSPGAPCGCLPHAPKDAAEKIGKVAHTSAAASPAKQIVEIVHMDAGIPPARRLGKPVIPVKTAGRASLLPASVRLAQLIVPGPFLGIAQNLVGFVDILKSFFRLFAARVTVRMVLQRQLAISPLDLLFARAAPYT